MLKILMNQHLIHFNNNLKMGTIDADQWDEPTTQDLSITM